jgi:hypothetical protein
MEAKVKFRPVESAFPGTGSSWGMYLLLKVIRHITYFYKTPTNNGVF